MKFMNAINEKRNKKGFTLAELLVVVAIIAILVAVSIPIFSGKLEAAREETDIANMRAAKAAAVTEYLTEQKSGTYYYNAAKGVLEASKGAGYGKGTSANGGCADYMGYTNATVAKDLAIKVTVSDAGEVTIAWE